LDHDDSITSEYHPEYAADIPFTEKDIELYPIGEDGHIITK
jgi:hypothetical protein